MQNRSGSGLNVKKEIKAAWLATTTTSSALVGLMKRISWNSLKTRTC